MLHMTLFSLFGSLINKASDGDLTLEEVAECLSDAFPDYFDDVLEAVKEAQEDGSIGVWDVINIVTAVVK